MTLHQFLYAELDEGKRPVHKPTLSYKDCIKNSLQKINITQNDWVKLTLDHSSWRKEVHGAKRDFGPNHVARENLKRDIYKRLYLNFPEILASKFDLTCNEWSNTYVEIKE